MAVSIEERLCRAQRTFDLAAKRSEALRKRRDGLVVEALDAGFTHARIAVAMGVSKSRVTQIAIRVQRGDR